MEPSTAQLLFKAFIVLGGVACVWMGYRLFVRGVFEGGAAVEIDAGPGAGPGARVALTRGGPGLVFALFGMGIIAIGVWRPMSTDRTTVEIPGTAADARLSTEGFELIQRVGGLLHACNTRVAGLKATIAVQETANPDGPKKKEKSNMLPGPGTKAADSKVSDDELREAERLLAELVGTHGAESIKITHSETLNNEKPPDRPPSRIDPEAQREVMGPRGDISPRKDLPTRKDLRRMLQKLGQPAGPSAPPAVPKDLAKAPGVVSRVPGALQ